MSTIKLFLIRDSTFNITDIYIYIYMNWILRRQGLWGVRININTSDFSRSPVNYKVSLLSQLTTRFNSYKEVITHGPNNTYTINLCTKKYRLQNSK